MRVDEILLRRRRELGTLYLALEPASISQAFGTVIGSRFAIIVVLVLCTGLLPRFTNHQGDAHPVEI
jgi:hypothetical protein